MALYRTYRPATFAEVVGQEHVTDPLRRALDTGRINHAYLFSGPRGCGKTSSARILARSLNCVDGPTSTPCGTCSSCVALAPGGPGNLDVIELDAASHGGVDDTRELRDRAFFAPSESRYRVFIVDEAHMVTNAGFNALLKIVEEPPEHLIFIFATTEPEKVLPTIRSRTHHYPFRLLPPPVMRGLLEKICASEQVQVAPEVFPLVIRAGGGSPRDSLSVLDQLLAGAGEEGVTYDRALSLLGVTDVALLDETIDALAAADGALLFGTVEKVVDAGHDPRRFSTDLLERLRDLILLQAVPDAADRGLVEAPGDQLQRMRGQIETLGPASLTRFAEIVHAALGEMRGTTSPRLLLEVMCARMLLPAVSDDEAALLQRLERLEAGVATPPRSVVADPAGSAPAAAESAPRPPANEPPPKFIRPSQRKAAEEAAAEQSAEQAAADHGATGQQEAEQQEAEQQEAERRTAEEQEAERQAAEQQQAEQQEAEQREAERQAAERKASEERAAAATERAEQEAADKAQHEAAEREAAQRAVREAAEREAAEQAQREAAEAEAREQAARAAAERDAAEKAREDERRAAAQSTPPPTPPTPTPPTPTRPEPPQAHESPAEPYDDIPPPDAPLDDDDAPPEPYPATAQQVSSPESPASESSVLTVETLRQRYQDMRSAVRARSKSLEPMLSAAMIHDLQGTTVVLGHPIEVLVGRLSAPHAVEIMRGALKEVFTTDLDVRTVHVPPGSAGPAAAPAPTTGQPQRRQTFSRPSQAGPSGPPGGNAGAGASDLPPEPEEPAEPEPPRPDEELTDAERAEMVEQARTGGPETRYDPEEVALNLLKTELGARLLE